MKFCFIHGTNEYVSKISWLDDASRHGWIEREELSPDKFQFASL
jgi:hypothetical protein